MPFGLAASCRPSATARHPGTSPPVPDHLTKARINTGGMVLRRWRGSVRRGSEQGRGAHGGGGFPLSSEGRGRGPAREAWTTGATWVPWSHSPDRRSTTRRCIIATATSLSRVPAVGPTTPSPTSPRGWRRNITRAKQGRRRLRRHRSLGAEAIDSQGRPCVSGLGCHRPCYPPVLDGTSKRAHTQIQKGARRGASGLACAEDGRASALPLRVLSCPPRGRPRPSVVGIGGTRDGLT